MEVVEDQPPAIWAMKPDRQEVANFDSSDQWFHRVDGVWVAFDDIYRIEEVAF